MANRVICIRITPEEHRAVEAACRDIRTTRSWLIRFMLSPVFSTYDAKAPNPGPELERTIRPVETLPKRDTLRYDPSENSRLWHHDKAKRRAENAQAVQDAFLRAGGNPDRMPATQPLRPDPRMFAPPNADTGKMVVEKRGFRE